MKQAIIDATHGGLDIILYYYPQAQECINSKKKFKLRASERTASAAIKEFNGIWHVTDFGDDGKALSPFDIAMKEENLPFNQVLFLLADRYNVGSRLTADINKPKITSRLAKAGECDGDFSYKSRKEPSADELKVLGPMVSKDTCARYNYFALEYYTITSKDDNGRLRTIKFESTDKYPIFLRECGDFRKIYKPNEPNKAFRFFYKGTKPKDYINGLAELKAAFAKLEAEYIDDREESRDSHRYRKKKLPEAIFCSGERDALNCAGMGYFPLWLNSETATLSEREMADISRMCEKIYNVPDIDKTGVRRGCDFALKHLEVYTVTLPEWLRTYKDNRGNPRKDLRDFLELRPYTAEFAAMLGTAKQCKFWSITETEKGRRSEINTAHLLWFLQCNGFAKITDTVSHTDRYVRVDGYKVEEFTPKQIRSFVRIELERRFIPTEIINLYLNSKRTSTTLADDLPMAEIDFAKNTYNSRTFFFQNKSVTVRASGIEIIGNNDIQAHTWSNDISPHIYKEIEPAFTITDDAAIKGNIIFSVKNTDSHVFRYLINASRIYWREEFERRLDATAEQNEAYCTANRFNIFGPRLTLEEQSEQVRHLINKIYTLGYMLHRYKFDSKSLAVWIMENRLTDEDESSGGSGKSFFLKAIKKLGMANIVTLQGRDRRITENKHLLDRVSSNTDILLIDDANRYIDFDYFYTMITGDTTVNPKGDKSFEIEYKDSPIIAFTSNFPPPNDDSSTMRRILNVVFSDYYHQKTPNNDYRETRSIYDDFGCELFSDNYKEEYYNQDINFMLNCLQFYLSTIDKNKIWQPPMENVLKRINIAKMGNSFRDWAETFFSADNDNLNVLLNRIDTFTKFKVETGNQQWKMQRFTKALRAFCENADHIEALNPKELLNQQGRLIKKRGTQAIECIYVQSKGEPLNPRFKDEF